MEVARAHLGLWEVWVFVLPVDRTLGELTDQEARIAAAAQDHFGLENQIEDDRRQDRLF
jgi:hypothetical protein